MRVHRVMQIKNSVLTKTKQDFFMVLTILVRTLVNDGSLFSHLLTDVCNSLCSLQDCCQRSSSSHHVQLSPPDEGRIEEPYQASTARQITILFPFSLTNIYLNTSPSFPSRYAHNKLSSVARVANDQRCAVQR